MLMLTSIGSWPLGLHSREVGDSRGVAFVHSYSRSWDMKLRKEIRELFILYIVEYRASMELATRLKTECAGLLEQARLELVVGT